MPDIFKNDQILWYRNGVWGDLGYAVPNFGLGAKTMNATIQKICATMGRNLSAVMHDTDADLRTPPSINTLTKIHKLICRARQIVGGRAVPPGTPNMETVHVAPGTMDQLVYPVPYFRVRNDYLKEYCGLILAAVAEAMQHTENRQPFEISTTFEATISQLLQRVYVSMATELLQIDKKTALDPAFVITDAQLRAYNPSAWFSSTEMIDVNPPIISIPTDVDLQVLTDGIPASQVVGLSKWPSGEPYNPMAGSTVTQTGSSAGGNSIPGMDPTGGSTAGAGGATAPAAAAATATSNIPPFAAPPSP